MADPGANPPQIASPLTDVCEQKLSAAQRLPDDVICEIYYVWALIDPPLYAGPSNFHEKFIVRSLQSDLNLDLYPLWTGVRGPYWHAELETIKRRAMFSEKGSLGWISGTLVCQSWRQAGTNLASLWGDVLHVFPSALDTVLARSRCAPIALDFGAVRSLPELKQTSLHNVYFALAAQNVDRTRSLVADNSRCSFREWHAIILGKELPVLEDLTIKGGKRILEVVSTPLTPLLAPSMTRLVFDQTVFIPFSAPSLRSLVVQGASPSVSPSVLLTALSTTPNLQRLELMFSLHDEPLPEDTPPAHLPDLAIARLCDSPESLVIWKHIIAPPNVELRMHAFRMKSLDGSVTDSLGHLFTAIRPHLCNPAIDAFSLVYDASYNTFVIGLGVSTSIDSTDALPTNRVTLRILFRDIIIEFGTIPAFLARLTREMVPENITLLHSSPCPPIEDFLDVDLFEVGNLVPVLQSFIRLHTLSIGHHLGRRQPFLEALEPRDDAGVAAASSLHTLVFAAVDDNNALVGKGRVAKIDKRWENLASTLAKRAKAGTRLPRLVLRGQRSLSERIQPGGLPGLRAVRAETLDMVDERLWCDVVNM